jgi:hypothetical protein
MTIDLKHETGRILADGAGFKTGDKWFYRDSITVVAVCHPGQF